MAIKWSEAKCVFVYLHKTKNGFYYAIEDMECAYVMSYLKQNNIETQMYVDNDLGTTVEISDDILSMGENCIVFKITTENYRLVNILSSQILNEDDQVKILWFGDKSMISKLDLSKKNFDAFIYNNYEDALFYLIEKDFSEWGVLSTVIYNRVNLESDQVLKSTYIPISSIDSPYNNGIISGQSGFQVGIMLGRQNQGSKNQLDNRELSEILLDYKNIASHHMDVEKKNIKLIINHFFDFKDWKKLLIEINQISSDYSLEIFLNGCSALKDNFETLLEYKIRRINLLVENEKDMHNLIDAYMHYKDQFNLMKLSLSVSNSIISNAEIYNDQIAYLVDEGILEKGELKIVDSFDTETNQTQLNSLKKYLNRKNKTLYSAIQKLNQVHGTEYDGSNYYEIPLLNGFVAYKTGSYHRLKNAITKHVMVNYEDLNPNLFKSLKEFTSVNSAVFINNVGKINEGKIYLENFSALKYEDPFYDDSISKCEADEYFLSHLHRIEQTQDPQKSILHLNNYKRDRKMHVIESTFSEVAPLREPNDFSLEFIQIKSKEDVENFIAEADYFKATGKLDKSSLLNKQMINLCRWSSNGGCLLNFTPRMEVKSNGDIFTCIDCSNSLGNISQFQYEVVKKTYEMKEKELIQRECMSCPVERSCSKCVMLPDFMPRELYCQIRREKPHIQEYIITMTIINYIYKNSHILKNVDLGEARVINGHTFHLTKEIPFGQDEEFLFKPIVILYLNESPILWSPVLSKFYKITKDLVFIIELMLKNIEPQNIVPILSSQYKISSDEAKKCCDVAYDMLYKFGCIKRHVSI